MPALVLLRGWTPVTAAGDAAREVEEDSVRPDSFRITARQDDRHASSAASGHPGLAGRAGRQ